MVVPNQPVLTVDTVSAADKNKEVSLLSKINNLGLIHVITGNGKGKTTSAMGIVLRALGNGLRVKVIQLFKDETGEKFFFQRIQENETKNTLALSYSQFNFSHPALKKYGKAEMKLLRQSFNDFWAKQIADTDKYDLLVVDELGAALNSNLINEQRFLEFIQKKPKKLELIITGREIPETIRARADYICEIVSVKHPFEKGITARKGIEF